MERFLLLAVVALALAAPLVLGWQRRGWRGLAVLLLVGWAFAGTAAVALYRADQACLATPDCRSHSGILWNLLGAAVVGYPLLAGALQAAATLARAKLRGG